MITKEKFIQDMESVLNNIDCSETNGFISYDSHWILSGIIEKVVLDADKYINAIKLKDLSEGNL